MAPSNKHVELQERALTWIGNMATGKGVRGATEIMVANEYVADAVVICTLQSRFDLKYKEMSGRGDLGCLTEQVCIFEIKVSRSDFLATFPSGWASTGKRDGNRLYPVGTLHWCVALPGLVYQSELPDFWGLLVPRGRGLTELKAPTFYPISLPILHEHAYQLLWVPSRWSFAEALKEKDQEIQRLEDKLEHDYRHNDEIEEGEG